VRESTQNDPVYRREEVRLQMSITKERKQEVIKTFQRRATDQGSPEVQIAVLTSKINSLTDHLRSHRKDYASRRGMLMMVSRRRRLLDYLKRINPEQYLEMLRRLELRK
jgi:small subunit ribosomal protein S15